MQNTDTTTLEPRSRTQMDESYERLLKAARELRRVDTVADIARILSVSLQTMQHWKRRGVPDGKLVEIEEKIGALPKWITTGEGEMTKSRQRLGESTLTVEQKEALYLLDSIGNEARIAWMRVGKALSSLSRDGQKSEETCKEMIRTSTYEGPDRRRQNKSYNPDRRGNGAQETCNKPH
jgi:hypothetical protein